MEHYYSDKFVGTCLELGMQNGFNRINLSEVARRLNLDETVIYALYPSQEKLVEECIMRLFEKIDLQVSPLLEDPQLDTLSKWNRTILVIAENLEWISNKQLIDFQQHYPHLWEKVIQERKKRVETFEKLFAQGFKEGVFRSYPPKFIMRLYFSAIKECSSGAWLDYYNLTLADSLKRIHSLIMQGILSTTVK